MDVNIAGFIDDSIVDGPGLRTVIFFQGCNHNCFGCHNPDTHSTNENSIMNINKVVEYVKENTLTRKVTISGGEPFLQYTQLLELCKLLKNYNIWIYTGYTLKELEELNYLEITNYIEALVTGRFEYNKKTLDIPYIGSSNQKIIYFTT